MCHLMFHTNVCAMHRAGKADFWVYFWGYFSKKLTCESVDWVDCGQVAGLSQTVRQQKATFPSTTWNTRHSLSLDAGAQGCQASDSRFTPGSSLQTRSVLVWSVLLFRLPWTRQIIKNKNLLPHSSEGWEVQDQDSGRLRSSFTAPKVCLIAVSSREEEHWLCLCMAKGTRGEREREKERDPVSLVLHGEQS
jgi:hypothetical protein